LTDGANRAETANNAIALAKKPAYDKLLREFPNSLIQASDHFVVCPTGRWEQRSGPPEHRRWAHCADGYYAHRRRNRLGEFVKNPAIVRAMKQAQEAGGNCIFSDWSRTAAFTRS